MNESTPEPKVATLKGTSSQSGTSTAKEESRPSYVALANDILIDTNRTSDFLKEAERVSKEALASIKKQLATVDHTSAD